MNGKDFEEEVRRVAEAIWNLKPGDCKPEFYERDPDVRELDGVVRLQDVTHLIMATISTKLDKVKSDVGKLRSAAEKERRPGRPVSMWLITKRSLDAQHIKHCKSLEVETLTLRSFRRRFFDGEEYISKRRRVQFGSARNLKSGSPTIAEDEYVPLPLNLTKYKDRVPVSTKRVSVAAIAARLAEGHVILLVGPFGAGKSLTCREIFFELARMYMSNKSSHVPAVVNLREHWAQDYGDEILERHGRSIGFLPRQNMTVAWRAGMLALMLDGFDEIASRTLAPQDDVHFMSRMRFRSLEGVRRLVSGQPAGAGILICGRDHYFDNRSEMEKSLQLMTRDYSIVRVAEFTEDQADQYLRKNGVASPLPEWLPRKPLLLGYLAHKGILEKVASVDGARGFGYAWDQFLTLICEREAELESAAMRPATVRRVLERLACIVRASSSGTGPLTERSLAETYSTVTGQTAVDGVLAQLQRLPGLTERDQEPGARSFIDPDYLAALQGSAVASGILEQSEEMKYDSRGWLEELSPDGTTMAAYVIESLDGTSDLALGACQAFARDEKPGQILGDGLMVMLALVGEADILHCRKLAVRGVHLGMISLEDFSVKGLYLDECVVREIALGIGAETSDITVNHCLILKVSGVGSRDGLPSWIGRSNEIDEYDDFSTNNSIVKNTALPAAVRALLTVLRKLYLQPGSGRKMDSFYRGVPDGEVRDKVGVAIELVIAQGLATKGATGGLLPVRRHSERVHQILSAPMLSSDPLIVDVQG